MPRFYFHHHDGSTCTLDREGVVLPDAEAAWYQGVRSVRELFGEELKQGCLASPRFVAIEDEEGIPVWDLPLQEVGQLAP